MVTTKSIGSRHVFRSMLMHVVVPQMAAIDHRAGDRCAETDHQVRQVVQSFAVPDSKVDMIMVHDLNADAAKQATNVHRPGKTNTPLCNGQADVKYDVGD